MLPYTTGPRWRPTPKGNGGRFIFSRSRSKRAIPSRAARTADKAALQRRAFAFRCYRKDRQQAVTDELEYLATKRLDRSDQPSRAIVERGNQLIEFNVSERRVKSLNRKSIRLRQSLTGASPDRPV